MCQYSITVTPQTLISPFYLEPYFSIPYQLSIGVLRFWAQLFFVGQLGSVYAEVAHVYNIPISKAHRNCISICNGLYCSDY